MTSSTSRWGDENQVGNQSSNRFVMLVFAGHVPAPLQAFPSNHLNAVTASAMLSLSSNVSVTSFDVLT
jgi:hypothetical protein